MKKKVFITGASGFLGNVLLGNLGDSYEITLLRHKTSINNSKYKIVVGGIEDINSWEESLSGIDTVIHLAGLTHSKNPSEYRKVNTIGSINLLRASQKHKVKQFIYMSTRALGKGCGPYGESKKEAEDFIKKSKINYTILRVAEAYDRRFYAKEGLANMAKLIKKSFIVPYPVANGVTLSPIDATDVANCIIAAIESRKAYGKIYVLAGPENLSLRHVLARIAKSMGLKRLFVPFPIELLKVFLTSAQFLGIVATADQLGRFMCKKEALSQNVWKDLKIKPKKFLV